MPVLRARLCPLLLASLALLLPAAALDVDAAGAPGPGEEEMYFGTSGQDAGVHAGAHANDPRAYVGGLLTGDTHRYWLKFDLSALPANVDKITSATLVLTAGRKSILPIGVGLGADGWDAATLTWANQPTYGTPTGVVNYTYVANTTYSWDVTQHIADEVAAADPTVSLVLQREPEGASGANVWFYTDSYATTAAQKPSLCVTYTRRSDTPPVVTVGEPVVFECPNHKWRTVHLSDLATATDEQDGVLDLMSAGKITGVTSNEPADAKGFGDGHTKTDIRIVGPATVQLRAERARGGAGRVYTIRFVVTDSGGSETAAVAEVHVPRDWKCGRYDSTWLHDLMHNALAKRALARKAARKAARKKSRRYTRRRHR